MRREKSTSELMRFKAKKLQQLWKCWDSSVFLLLPVWRGSTKTPWANPWNSGHSLNLTYNLVLLYFMVIFLYFSDPWFRSGVIVLGFKVWDSGQGSMFGNPGEADSWRSRRGIPQDVTFLWLDPWSLSKQPALLQVTLWLPKLLISNLFPINIQWNQWGWKRPLSSEGAEQSRCVRAARWNPG